VDNKNWYNKVREFAKQENLQNIKLYFDPDYSRKQFKDILQNEDIIEYNIVLHDGPHSVDLRIAAMEFIHSFVKPGGYLIIDDMHKGLCSEATRKYLDILQWEKLVFPRGLDPFGRKKKAIVYQRPIK